MRDSGLAACLHLIRRCCTSHQRHTRSTCCQAPTCEPGWELQRGGLPQRLAQLRAGTTTQHQEVVQSCIPARGRCDLDERPTPCLPEARAPVAAATSRRASRGGPLRRQRQRRGRWGDAAELSCNLTKDMTKDCCADALHPVHMVLHAACGAEACPACRLGRCRGYAPARPACPD